MPKCFNSISSKSYVFLSLIVKTVSSSSESESKLESYLALSPHLLSCSFCLAVVSSQILNVDSLERSNWYASSPYLVRCGDGVTDTGGVELLNSQSLSCSVIYFTSVSAIRCRLTLVVRMYGRVLFGFLAFETCRQGM